MNVKRIAALSILLLMALLIASATSVVGLGQLRGASGLNTATEKVPEDSVASCVLGALVGDDESDGNGVDPAEAGNPGHTGCVALLVGFQD